MHVRHVGGLEVIHRGLRGRQDGQTLVEFALVLPIFLLVVFGVFDLGRAVYTNSVVSQAAREGARLAATEAGWVGFSGSPCASGAADVGPVCPADPTALKADVVDAVNRMTAAVGPISDVHLSCNIGDAGDPIPTGEWTEGSGGNGCDDGAGVPLGAAGEFVSVRVEYDYQLFTPFVTSIIGTIPLNGSATMTIN